MWWGEELELQVQWRPHLTVASSSRLNDELPSQPVQPHLRRIEGLPAPVRRISWARGTHGRH